MHVSLFLLALAAGYGVLVLSQGQSRPLDAIGRAVGGIVLIVSLLALLGAAVCGLKCMKGGSCGGSMGGWRSGAGGGGCSFMNHSAPTPSDQKTQ